MSRLKNALGAVHRSMAGDAGRVLRWALAAVLGVEIAYLLAANLVLSAFVSRWLNKDPNDLFVRYESAFSPWPGRVWARDLEMRMQDTNVQFLLQIGRVTVDIDMLALASRTFRATPVRVTGARFRFRHKIQDLAGDELRVKALPPIPGFADPPLLTPRAKPASDKLWTVELGAVDARFEELWIQEYRYVGEARARGGFRLEPRKRFRVDAGRLELAPGQLYAGADELVAKSFSGTIEANVEEHAIAEFPGLDVLKKISTRIKLDADIADLDFARLYLEPGTRVKLGKGQGKIVTDIVVERGRLEPPSRATYASKELSLATPRLEVLGDAGVVADVNRERIARLRMSGASIRAFDPKASAIPEARIERAELGLEVKNFALYEPLHMTGGNISVGDLTIPDLRLLNAFFSGPLRTEGGAVRGSARGQLGADGALVGKVLLNLDRARFRQRDVGVVATGTLRGSLRQPNVREGRGTYEDASLVLKQVELRTSRGRSGVGWLRIDAGPLPFTSFKPDRISARLRAGFPHARPLLAALGIEPGGVPKLALSLMDLSDLKVTANFVVRENNQGIWLEQAETAALSARGAWQKKGNTERGAFLLTTNIGKVGIELAPDGPNFDLFAGEGWLTRKISELGLNTLSVNGGAGRAPRTSREPRKQAPAPPPPKAKQ